ncbi:MAG TPA: hypothetical protein VGD55_00605 [Acidothermaceae bacterium]
MTALSVPAQPRRDAGARPVPWRRMGWVTWRQHRLTLAGLTAVLGAVSVYLLVTGMHVRGTGTGGYSAMGPFTLTSALFQVIPPLIGAFVGAPVLARELESGTFRFTWTQGFGRTRWTIATLTPLAVAVTLQAGAVGVLYRWCYGPMIGGKYGVSPLTGNTFDIHGLAFAAWTLTAFSIGALAGGLIRRVVPAMFATLAAWSGLAVVTAVYLRPHYEALLVTNNPNLPTGAWVKSQWWAQSGNPISRATVNHVLQQGGITSVPDQFPRTPPGSTAANTDPMQYLLHHGITFVSSYQPASRFWPFQWIEGSWLLLLSLVLTGTVVWLVQRRAT